MTTFFRHVYLDGQRLRVPPNVVNITTWGGSPDNDDNYSSIVGAMTAIAQMGGGTLEFGPYTYKCLSRLAVPNGVSLRGVAGCTQLDFSGKATFESGFQDGLIRAFGSLGTAVALTQTAKRTPLIAVRLLSATRAGTVVTAQTDMVHSLSIGDPIWITGNPATVGQAVFYTVRQSIGWAARTTPYVVASVIDPLQFTYVVANTGDTILVVDEAATPFCYFASDVLRVASTTGLAVGTDVLIRSQAFRTSAALAEQAHIGEFGKVARILSSTMILLQSEVQDDYAVSDTAQVVPVIFQKGFSVEGIEVIGKGANTASGYGDVGIRSYLCEAPRIENCKFTNVDQSGVHIWSCLSGRLCGNQVTFDVSDEAGFASGALDIQYGLVFAGCTTGLVITNNHIYGGRHGIVQSTTSNAAYHGIARNITITSNTVKGTYLAAIVSHQAVDSWLISGNHLIGCQGGVSPRYSRDTVIADNVITAYSYGVYAYNYVGNFTVANNTIRASQWGIRAGRDADVASQYGPFKIIGNNCEGGEYGIYVFDATAGTVAIDIDISGNTTRNTKYEGIRVSIGDVVSAADGWSGKVNNNTIIDAGQLPSGRSGMYLTNMRGGSASDNIFKGTRLLHYAIHLEGVGTGNGLVFWDNVVAPGLLDAGAIDSQVGYWHRTNMMPIDPTDGLIVIASDAISPRIAYPMLVIDTEALAAADDLSTILAGFVGQSVSLRSAASARVITIKDNVGNIQLAGSADRVLDSSRDVLSLQWNGAVWTEVAFASN